ncbi:hypothetical protein Lepto7376_3821 [[Leptolyngbya] sp. PCC 7376]|uniref:hypothetical protein n=1 Tax=[Leptolyngbya] sp. PCC 7376 TaxID=111781 RepID=UPI00029F36DD|nr:hypothetical protein [[Leptolyngbya] sp. PCC 7376]AFY39980.1 hypothetical protein Lepto7376_3821 [[Leptolyngbya] sp. PCC 7376]
MFELLGLSEYYPNKLGREEVYTLSQYSLSNTTSQATQDLPFYFLANLLALNYQARWLKVEYQREESDDDDDIWNEDESNIEPTTQQVHPLDVIIATLLCCHPIIHQDLVVKLWECKLAIPLVVQESQEHPPKFFLWAMRALVMRWKRTQGQELRSEERAIADYPMQTISFIRLDRSEISKSALLNTVIFGSNPHDVFFHRDSEGSNHYRQLAEGSIELAWHLPEGDFLTNTGTQNNFQLDNITAFANLRGDARQYPQQLELIKHISSYIFLFVSAKELQSSVSIIKKFLSAGKAVILLLTNKSIEPIDNQSIKDWIENFKTENKLKQISFIKLSGKSIPEIREKIRQQLTRLNPIIDKPEISLESLAEIMSQEGMDIDEYDDDCQQGIQQANKILEIVRQYPPDERKAKLLPLQNKLWKDWADADKEMVRQEYNTQEEDSGKYYRRHNSIKKNSRQQQLDIIQSSQLSQVVRDFITGLSQNSKNIRKYFIKQLQLELDNLSRSILSDLNSAYTNKINQLTTHDKSLDLKNSDQHQKIHRELAEIDKQIIAQSLGLENLLREIGQIYLAIGTSNSQDLTPLLRELYKSLPQLVAELLMSGYQLEIIDGEVSCLPWEWVEAVLQQFIQLLKTQGLQNPRIFVLSATGIQSSGKSTLLNAMFGLSFNVSVGRCTKGISLQTVKLDENLRNKFHIDYIFVLDTEGIKSSEHSSHSGLEHDNELSTFVIGLSNLCLIKISGENSIYLQDTLPISLEAFMRMPEIVLKPQIKIIHRNIEVCSSEKLNKQNLILTNKLDEYTKIACENENRSLQSFNEVINFNINQDVHYLGGLYNGTSSLSPISKSYIQDIHNLKNKLFGNLDITHIYNINTFLRTIRILWNYIKNDQFIYSFRNVIEVKCQIEIDDFLNKAIQKFEHETCDLLRITYLEISKSSYTASNSMILDKSEKRIFDFLNNLWLKENSKLDLFFEDLKARYGRSFKQQKLISSQKLDDLRERLKRESRWKTKKYQENYHHDLILDKDSSLFHQNLIDEIIKFTTREKEFLCNLSHRELRQKFDISWDNWIEKISENISWSFTIETDIEYILRHQYSLLYKTIIVRKGNKNFRDCQLQSFYSRRAYYSYFSRSIASDMVFRNETYIHKVIQSLRDDLLKSLRADLYHREKELQRYESSYLNVFLSQVNSYFEKTSMSLEKEGVILTKECRADLFIILCGYAIRKLENIDFLWRESLKPIIKLKQEKERYWLFFLKNR